MRPLSVIVAVAIILAPATALADDTLPPEPPVDYPQVMPSSHLFLKNGDGVLRTLDNNLFLIPKGSHILTGDKWNDLDHELIRLQESETRLTAENESFRRSADSWRPSWKTIAIALGTGLAAGWYLHDKF